MSLILMLTEKQNKQMGKQNRKLIENNTELIENNTNRIEALNTKFKDVDKKFKNTFGILFDDILAGLYVVLCLILFMVGKTYLLQ